MCKIFAKIITLPLIIFAAEWQNLNGPPAGRADDMSLGLYQGQWVIYVADQTHKLYKSTNEGEYWDSIYLDPNIINPTCVITRPNDAQVVFIGKNNVTPVWWSIDGGANWEERSGTPPNNITNTIPHCFAIASDDANIVFAGFDWMFQNKSLYKTTNGGETWTAIDLTVNNELSVYDIAVVAGSPHRVYLAASKGGASLPDSGFYLSIDDGSTFQQTLKADVRAVAYDAANSQNVWEGEIRAFPPSTGPRGAVRRSTDGGLSWIPDQNSPPYFLPKGSTITAVALTNTAGLVRVYAATDSGMFLSMDNGQNWTEINDGIYVPDIRAIAIDPSNAQNLYLGGEAAIYRSSNGGQNWLEKTRGMKLVWAVGISTSLPNAIYVMGTQTVHKSIDQGQSWMAIDNGTIYTARLIILRL